MAARKLVYVLLGYTFHQLRCSSIKRLGYYGVATSSQRNLKDQCSLKKLPFPRRYLQRRTCKCVCPHASCFLARHTVDRVSAGARTKLLQGAAETMQTCGAACMYFNRSLDLVHPSQRWFALMFMARLMAIKDGRLWKGRLVRHCLFVFRQALWLDVRPLLPPPVEL